MDLISSIIGVIRVILGLFLLLFLPGFAITGALYPAKDAIPLIERLGYSFVLSIVSVMLSVLFIDLIVGVDTTAMNIVITILILTGAAATIWNFELYFQSRIKGKYQIGPFIRTHVQSLEDHARKVWMRVKKKG